MAKQDSGRQRGGPLPREVKSATAKTMAVAEPVEPLFPPDDSWLPQVRAAWDAFWSSPVAHLVCPDDYGPLSRYWEWAAEYAELSDRWQKMPVEAAADSGVAAQVTVLASGRREEHPISARLTRLGRWMRETEGVFGMSPYARARLGIAVGAMELTQTEVESRRAKADAKSEAQAAKAARAKLKAVLAE